MRLRTGKRELSLHLCQTHQDGLRDLVMDFCEEGDPREVQPSLKAS